MAGYDIDPDVISTLYNEAGDQGDLGLQAVASVMRNRATASGRDLRGVVSFPHQFEGYRPGSLDPNSAAFQRVAAVAGPILSGAADPITDADSYYSPSLVKARGNGAPTWDDGSGVDLGGHRFFKTGWGGGKSRISGMGGGGPVAGDAGSGPSMDENPRRLGRAGR